VFINSQPEEFVQAGDHLVHASPTWSWQRGDISRIRPYLPSDKQYLVTRRVRCQRRVKSLQDSAAEGVDRIVMLDGESDWIEPGGSGGDSASSVPASGAPASDVDEYEDITSAVITDTIAKPSAALAPTALSPTEADDEYADLASYVDTSLVVSDAGAVANPASFKKPAAAASRLAESSRSYGEYV
jgi:hypothetical protein